MEVGGEVVRFLKMLLHLQSGNSNNNFSTWRTYRLSFGGGGIPFCFGLPPGYADIV